MSLIAELKRRNVFPVGVAYAFVGWLLVEVASVVLPDLRCADSRPKEQRKTPLVPLFIVAAALATALAGCTAKVELVPLPMGERATLIEKLPLTVGLLYDQRFQDYTYERCIDVEQPGGSSFIIRFTPTPCSAFAYQITADIGKASVELVDRMMRALFEHVEIVDSRPPSSQTSNALDAIVEPEILEYEISADPDAGEVDAKITYRLILSTPSGAEVARWSISGKCVGRSSIGWSIAVRNCTHCALRDVEAKVLVGFREQPEMKRWFTGYAILNPDSTRHDR